MIDCDVMVADGGTRTTSISGAYVAVSLAVRKLMDQGLLKTSPIITQIGAVSVGVNGDGQIIADLNYEEDSSCETDMNVVMNRQGRFIEIQGTAEKNPFSEEQLGTMLRIARMSIDTIFEKQDAILRL